MAKSDKANKMTRKQQEIYDFIAAFITEHSYPPSVREICDGVGLRSPSTVHFHLQNMEEKGFLAKDGKARALTLAQTAEKAAAAPAEPVYDEPDIPAGRVPIVGTVAAGTPILAQECIEDYLTFDTNGRDGEYFALRVRGESMLNAGILPGDLVVVHLQREAHNGEIVVARIEDDATVKRLQRRNGEVWLLPENDAYEPIDGRYASILGTVSAVVRTYS